MAQSLCSSSSSIASDDILLQEQQVDLHPVHPGESLKGIREHRDLVFPQVLVQVCH